MTQPASPKRDGDDLRGIAVHSSETKEFLFEFVPSVAVVKVTAHGRTYLVDVTQLVAMHSRGQRQVTAAPLSQIKRMEDGTDASPRKA